jgi:hypothetical protein
MLFTQWDVLAVIIALLGCLTVMGLFWKQNIALQKENIKLRKRLVEQEMKGILHR